MVRPATEIGLSVKRLQWRHHRAANAALAPLGLSLVQWDALRHLHGNPEASLHDLAGLTFQTDQSFGTLAGRMNFAPLTDEELATFDRLLRKLADQRSSSSS
jgi:hypothetical protein